MAELQQTYYEHWLFVLKTSSSSYLECSQKQILQIVLNTQELPCDAPLSEDQDISICEV